VWLVQTPDGGWRPGIGDPTLIGWFTVLAYFATALLCYRALRSASNAGPSSRGLVVGWSLLCVLMVALGLNKQLDLQSLMTVVSRRLAIEQGWYEERHVVQVWFIAALSTLAMAAAAICGFWMRGHLREFWLALLGGAFIALFVVVRATSFHHVDSFLRSTSFGVRWNGLLELGGIGCIALNAVGRLSAAKEPAAIVNPTEPSS
jgi:hypothetical protein